ncbi:hypothetical protein EA462_08965 [Natrarchaeobius halalkaliphilus]|uniref:Uncharacterized protein n=1 Tax=Natrarchaeobius halalkaliphilus TaxID=1679091 RepID=A0A3N6P406_9EURY|nr:hypothetical protein [Natrarchaeobius halalkaliphilus]RQG90115.1 hypothetical protein EA462_08965 [Natrarchaeobius halalkaliphilus]
MERTPNGTAVGVDDPYEFAGICDYLTNDGRCRYAFDHYEADPEFARDRAREDYACPVVDSGSEADSGAPDRESDALPGWSDCPHFRSRNHDRECVRCGLEEKRIAHDDERPLLEEHHLSYADGLRSSGESDASDSVNLSHEITIYLCRWCHAKVHTSWARITDDVAPDPDAIAALEDRRGREYDELGFESAAERRDER